MIRRGIGLGGRLAAVAFAMALVLSLAGDFGRAATVPAVVNGQDPLEVLALKIRPNIIIVLDSSGSMTSTAPGNQTRSGDHPRSRMAQAKQVISQVIQDNQDNVSFQFGTYSQFSTTFNHSQTGRNRFQYTVSELDSPTELEVRRATGDSGERGLQSWQWIDAQWNTIWFDTGGATCSASVPAGFYQTGANLAAALQTAMRGTACGNDFNVGYQTGDGRFTFSRSGGGAFDIHWGDGGPNNIAEALGGRGGDDFISDYPYTLLYRSNSWGNAGDLAWPFSAGMDTRWRMDETTTPSVRYYNLATSRLWNGEVIRVDSNGVVCGMDFATPATMTDPATVTVQRADANCDADGPQAVFTFAGADFGHDDNASGDNCRGFRSKSDLVPCDLQSPPAPTQISMIEPYVDLEFPFDSNGLPRDLTTNGAAYGTPNYSVPDGIPDYVERMDGGWGVASMDIAPSAKAEGFTPIANSLIDIKGLADTSGDCVTNAPSPAGKLDSLVEDPVIGQCVERGFSKLWNQGQVGTTVKAGPGPWALDPIKDHGVCPVGNPGCNSWEKSPKEKTIVLFVTDGDDTCGSRQDDSSGGGDDNARRAAYWAEQLYAPILAADPASSVQTYVIGFGGAFSGGEPYRLNWIAWGGSGLGQGNTGQPAIGDDGDQWTDSDTDIRTARAQCTTCEDAFIAPDAATLAAQLQGIIDQGASDGEFSAQQSITESIFEYVDLASNMTDTYDPRDPKTRYLAIVPTRIISSFTLPGFRGQVKAYQNDGANNAVLKWSAGDVLQQQVSSGMQSACPDSPATSALLGECTFGDLISGGIARRVYTTTRNGVYTWNAASLEAYGRGGPAPPERTMLWPPNSQVAPTNYTDEGTLDEALGLPPDSSADPAGDFATLQAEFKACLGNNRPGGCTSGTASVQMKAARREAREMILAFMAGAQPVPEGTGPKRAIGGDDEEILYDARAWMLGDSELATAAVVTQPLPSEPNATPWVPEYVLFRDGDGASRPDSDQMIRQGYGLRNPDGDASGSGNDARANLKPVMTVVYSPANDMLHAFRAGPNVSRSIDCNPATPGHECGGQELWGFVPFDQLGALRLRFINEPQGRDNHVYMLARGVRFADVFVAADTPPMNVTINGQVHGVQGVWRRILYVLRGIGGKYITALDVTGPGPYTEDALATAGPIPLWSRGNPDTQDGTAGGADNGIDASDRLAYAEMGETWSMPTIAYRDKNTNTNTLYDTTRRPNGVDYVLFMGSGYGAAGEGSTFFTLDALSGDVIAAADVEAAATALGIDRPSLGYPNALVANAVGFNPAVFSLLATVHPAASAPTRIYIGDIHGRLWKFLTARPEVALPVADLTEDQPIGTAVSLLGMPPRPDTPVPHIFAVSGNDRRADGPFRMYAFKDNGTDTDIAVTGTATNDGVTTYEPNIEWLHSRTYDQGLPEANCEYTEEAVFRGTIQPTTAFECSQITSGNCQNPVGRVFYGGTRLNLPNTVFAPPTPLACGIGTYPCRSSFDSIIYALGAKTGLAAYDLNASTDDAYRIFRDNRIAAIAMLADPDPTRGGSSFNPDEGEMKAPVKPPPPPGVPPTSQSATANVLMVRLPGQPPPSVHYGSTVCQ